MQMVKSYRGDYGSVWYEQPLEEVSNENRKWLEENNPTYIKKIDAENAYKKAWNDSLENIKISQEEWDSLSKEMERTNREFMEAHPVN